MLNDNYGLKRVAHRGASGEAPENTMAAIRLAIEKYRVDRVEVDLRLSREGIPLIFHDATLERTTNGKGRVAETSLEELRKLNAGFFFDPEGRGQFPFRAKHLVIPTLEELLREFPTTPFCLEIKDKPPEVVEKILRVIHKVEGTALGQRSLFIGSFHDSVARELRRQSPSSLETVLAQGEVLKAYFAFRVGFRKIRLHSRYAFLPPKQKGFSLDTPGWVDFLHFQKVRIFYWTVNEPLEMERLIERGADGILTDFPSRLNTLQTRIDKLAH